MKKEWLILVVIIIVSLVLRSSTLFQQGMLGSDPYYHYAYTRSLINNEVVNRSFQLSEYPHNAKNEQPTGLYWLPLLLNSLGFPLLLSFKLTPLIMTSINLIIFYFLIKKQFSTRIALISTAFLGLCGAHLTRTLAGNYRGEMFAIPLLLLSLYFMNTKHGFLTGVTGGVSAFFWNGYSLIYALIILSYSLMILLKYLKGALDKKLIIEFTLTIILLKSFSYLSLNLNVLYYEQPIAHALIPTLLLPIIFSFLLILDALTNKKLRVTHKIIVLVVISLILTSSFFIIKAARSLLRQLLEFSFYKNDAFWGSITELGIPAINVLLNNYGFMLLLFPLSYLFFLKNKNTKLIGLILFSLPVFLLLLAQIEGLLLDSLNIHFYPLNYLLINTPLNIVLTFTAKRFLIFHALTISFLSAITLNKLSGFLKKTRRTYFILSIIILQGFLVMNYALTSPSFKPIPTYWLEAINWMKQNLSMNASITTWWDQGSKIQALAGIPTSMDSVGGQDVGRIINLSKFYLSNNPYDFSMIDWNTTHLLLSKELIKVYNGQSQLGTIIRIAGVNPVDYAYSELTRVSENNNEITYSYDNNEAVFNKETKELTLQDGTHISRIIIVNELMSVQEHIIPNDSIPGCFIKTPESAYLMTEKLCNTNYVKLMFFNELPGFSPVYLSENIKIYEIKGLIK